MLFLDMLSLCRAAELLRITVILRYQQIYFISRLILI